MPEGDTLHRIAARIGPALSDRTVTRLALADRGDVEEAEGWRVDDVRALGKHLLIGFDAGWTLRTHLGMNGRVFVLDAGRRPPRTPTFLLRVTPAGATVVCVRAYRAELIRTHEVRRHARLARLGPDLLVDPPDLDGIVARALAPAHGAREIADILLDQRIGSGIGNVYKSEALFMERTHPRTPMRALSPGAVRRVYERAAELLRRNLRTPRRTTVPTRRRPHPGSPRLWVYERTGEPCLECGAPIVRLTQGDMARGTWLCPTCQPVPVTFRALDPSGGRRSRGRVRDRRTREEEPMSRTIRSLVVPVSDLGAAKAVYTTLFGEPHTDQPYYVGFNADGFEVSLAPQEDTSLGPVAYVDVEDLDGVRSSLLAAGATERVAPRQVAPGARVCVLEDTDGNAIGLRGA